MELSKETHATFRNRDDRRQRKSPYTRTTSCGTIGYKRRIHVPSHDHNATEPRVTHGQHFAQLWKVGRWNVLRCTRWRFVEGDGRSGPLWGPTGITSRGPSYDRQPTPLLPGSCEVVARCWRSRRRQSAVPDHRRGAHTATSGRIWLYL